MIFYYGIFDDVLWDNSRMNWTGIPWRLEIPRTNLAMSILDSFSLKFSGFASTWKFNIFFIGWFLPSLSSFTIMYWILFRRSKLCRWQVLDRPSRTRGAVTTIFLNFTSPWYLFEKLNNVWAKNIHSEGATFFCNSNSLKIAVNHFFHLFSSSYHSSGKKKKNSWVYNVCILNVLTWHT